MNISFSKKNTRVVSDRLQVEMRLRDMKLTPEALKSAVRMGQDARSNSTLNDPPGATGIHGWGRTVRGLREHTMPLGYARYSVDNIHGVINEDRTIVILVATGDDATGNSQAILKTAYPNGLKVQAVVKENARQLSLFPIDIIPINQTKQIPKCMYWLLVVYDGNDEVRSELSLPYEIGDDERVEVWSERIILDSIPLDSTPNMSNVPDVEPDLDIPLTRKA